jgi:hypothetical protein
MNIERGTRGERRGRGEGGERRGGGQAGEGEGEGEGDGEVEGEGTCCRKARALRAEARTTMAWALSAKISRERSSLAMLWRRMAVASSPCLSIASSSSSSPHFASAA